VAYFHRVFRQGLGRTPARYRNEEIAKRRSGGRVEAEPKAFPART
jgi:AraC-like DNA-binding protein